MLGLSTNPIPIKAAMKLLGRDTGELRMPMTPLEPAAEAKLRDHARQIRTVVGPRTSRRWIGLKRMRELAANPQSLARQFSGADGRLFDTARACRRISSPRVRRGPRRMPR